ncbi:MAG TPA: hypothetical protein VEG60_06865 [Candidatus Binatia bacterium]|nr:hypothetical protein [Candidatus Binatia bacterium]
MAEMTNKISLQDGTLVRHKVIGYEGTIEGKTEIRTCFTRRGMLLAIPPAKETFQYRVAVSGKSMRHIAPAEDLEIIDTIVEVVCFRCDYVFRSKPGVLDKPAGRCQCGRWICPACLACRPVEASEQSPCLTRRKRIKEGANEKKRKRA